MTAVSSALRRITLARTRLRIQPRGRLFSSSPLTGAPATPHYSLSIGAESDDDPLSRCTSNLSNVDLETGAARKAAFRRAAECVADGYCAQYGVPPGVCSSVAGPVAQAIADSADSVAVAFSNGFEIQTSAGPTIAEREAWARRAFSKAIDSTRQMHNALFPNDIWTRSEAEARDLWLAETRDVATLRLAEIYSRPGQYSPMPDLERRAREGGADGMDSSFLAYDYSANPGAIVQSDVRAGLNAVTQALVAQAAEERARAQIVQIDPSMTMRLPRQNVPLSRGQKVARVTLLGGGLWLLVKLVGMIRR